MFEEHVKHVRVSRGSVQRKVPSRATQRRGRCFPVPILFSLREQLKRFLRKLNLLLSQTRRFLRPRRRRRRRQNRFQNASKRIVCVVVVDTSQSARLSREGRRREKKSRHRHHHHPENGGGGGGGGGTKHPRRLSSSSSSSFPAAFAVVGRPQSCASFFFHYCVADTHKKIDFGQKCPHESLLRIHNASRKIEEEEKKIVLRFSLSLSLGRPRRSPLSRHTAPADSPLLMMPFRRTLSPYFFSLGGRKKKEQKKNRRKTGPKKKRKIIFSRSFFFFFSLSLTKRETTSNRNHFIKSTRSNRNVLETHTHT